jgi:hypothetical protein
MVTQTKERSSGVANADTSYGPRYQAIELAR